MVRLIPSLPAVYVTARAVWPLPRPLAPKLGLAAILLVTSQYHLWSRLSSDSVFGLKLGHSLELTRITLRPTT